jgi:hypothetical protein
MARIVMSWEEFVAHAYQQVQTENSNLKIAQPHFVKDFHQDGIGDMYDFPSWVEFEIADKEK